MLSTSVPYVPYAKHCLAAQQSHSRLGLPTGMLFRRVHPTVLVTHLEGDQVQRPKESQSRGSFGLRHHPAAFVSPYSQVISTCRNHCVPVAVVPVIQCPPSLAPARPPLSEPVLKLRRLLQKPRRAGHAADSRKFVLLRDYS